jgi:hypothetical protein
MRNYYKLIVIVLLAAMSFVPFYSVTVVPEWGLLFVNKDGSPASSISIDQRWQHYSLESGTKDHSDLGLQTDSNGYIKLPARQIRVSIFQIISAPIFDKIMSINPHASFGPASTIYCNTPQKCVVRYKEGNEKPQRVVLW